MFVFLMALKHPETANNYQNVERLLQSTLHSVCSQTNGEFKVVVVCNKVPSFSFEDERVHFHQVAFPPVEKVNGVLDKKQKFTDKGTKYFSGLLFARRFNPDYVYIMDSDDWVNARLVSTLQGLPRRSVWYVDKGCFVNLAAKEYKDRAGLLRYCGSTFIYNFDYLLEVANIQTSVDEKSTQQALIAATTEFFVVDLLSNHLINFNFYKKAKAEPAPIPLRAACWVQGTGENVSRTQGGDSGIPIDARFAKEFGVPDEHLNARKPTFKDRSRNLLAYLKSLVTWHYSRISGNKVF